MPEGVPKKTAREINPTFILIIAYQLIGLSTFSYLIYLDRHLSWLRLLFCVPADFLVAMSWPGYWLMKCFRWIAPSFSLVYLLLPFIIALLISNFELGPSANGLGWLLFSFKGRIGRRTYFLAGTSALLLGFGLLFLWARQDWGPLSLVLFIPFLWIAWALNVKRGHDLGHSVWLLVTLFIPVINVLAWIYILFFPSVAAENRFGKSPIRAV